MRARKADKTPRPAGWKPARRPAAPGTEAATPLKESMVTGKASPAKAAVGDKPVFAYIASRPQPQRGIAERVDALAARTLSKRPAAAVRCRRRTHNDSKPSNR